MSCSALSFLGLMCGGLPPGGEGRRLGMRGAESSSITPRSVKKEGGCVVKRGPVAAVCVTVAGAFSMWATPAFAYVGPGAGLSAIGAFLALILGVILAFVGFIWYPVKRFLRKGNAAGASPSEPGQKPGAESVEEGS
jgi:hypothetical protein